MSEEITFNFIPAEIQARIIWITGNIVCKAHGNYLIKQRIYNAGNAIPTKDESNLLLTLRREVLIMMETNMTLISEIYLPKVISGCDNVKISDIVTLHIDNNNVIRYNEYSGRRGGISKETIISLLSKTIDNNTLIKEDIINPMDTFKNIFTDISTTFLIFYNRFKNIIMLSNALDLSRKYTLIYLDNVFKYYNNSVTSLYSYCVLNIEMLEIECIGYSNILLCNSDKVLTNDVLDKLAGECTRLYDLLLAKISIMN